MYFNSKKVAVACLAQKRHFGSLLADIFGPDSDVLICTFAAKKIGSCLLKPWAETRYIFFFNDLPTDCRVHLTGP